VMLCLWLSRTDHMLSWILLARADGNLKSAHILPCVAGHTAG
jgi:hypothetical protein